MAIDNDVGGLGDKELLAEVGKNISQSLSTLAGAMQACADLMATQGGRTGAGDVVKLLGEVTARAAAVSLVHRHLSKNPGGGTVALDDYMPALWEALVSSVVPSGEWEFSLVGTDTARLAVDQALSVGLIVTEIMTNALKYAHPTGIAGKLGLSCRRDDNGIAVIEVFDDGVGLPEGFDPATDGGAGFRLIRALVRQLGADLSCVSEPVGLYFTIAVRPGFAGQ